jgi:hypothetical protein
MSVAGVLSTAAISLGTQLFQTRSHKIKHEFQKLGQDLQSGDLSAAQSDLTSLQKLQPKLSNASRSQSNDVVAKDFAQLATDLKANDAKAAQQDVTQLRQDMQTQIAARRRHVGGDDQTTQLFTQLGTVLQSGDLSAAQQAYSTMLQAYQQYAAAGSANSSSAGSSISFTA